MTQTFTLPATATRPALFVRRRRPRHPDTDAPPVLYVHGATFPSALSVAFRLDGRSWMDQLAAAGFDAWALDFAGFGRSGRYPAMDAAPATAPPLGRLPAALEQLRTVVDLVLARTGRPRLSLIAHSWGTLVAARLAAEHPELVSALVLFGPIAPRPGSPLPSSLPGPDALGAWYPLSVDAQHRRFTEEVPASEPPVLLDSHFAAWAAAWLATDPPHRRRTPPSVRVPGGPLVDIVATRAADLPYRPAEITAPVLVVRGAWDRFCSAADVAWLMAALSRSPGRARVTVPKGTHLLHLESSRHALHRAAALFLAGAVAPVGTGHEGPPCSS